MIQCVSTANDSNFTKYRKYVTVNHISWNCIKKVCYNFLRKHGVLVLIMKMNCPIEKTITHSKFTNFVSKRSGSLSSSNTHQSKCFFCSPIE